MKLTRGFWIALWMVLVLVTGYLAFSHSESRWHYGHGYSGSDGYHGSWMMGRSDDEDWGERDGPGHWMDRRDVPGGVYGMMPLMLEYLNGEQAKQAGKLQNEAEKTRRELMQKSREAHADLAKLYAAEKRDWIAIKNTTRVLSDLSAKQAEIAVDLQQKIDALLSDSQRQELARNWRKYVWKGR